MARTADCTRSSWSAKATPSRPERGTMATRSITPRSVSMARRPGVSLQELEQQIDGVIAEVIDKGVTAEELERAKTRLIADATYAADSQATLARWYGTVLATGGTIKDVQEWPSRIKAVTAEAVRDAAQHWLDKRR